MIVIISFLGCSGDDGPVTPTPDPDESGPENSAIPYIAIDTQGNTIVNEPKVIAHMNVYISQTLQLSTPIGIEFRGSTSLRLFDKKSYGIETRDAADQDIQIEVLGFPEEEDWILQGPYSDKTLLRNVLIYQLSNEMGRYAPRTRFVEIEINGSYKGVYAFMEKIKRDGDRVDLERLTTADNDPAVVSGGYILKIDKTSGDTEDDDWSGDAAYSEFLGFRSDFDPTGNRISAPPYGPKQGPETYFLYEYPRNDNITDAQKAYIQQYISDFEEALLGDNFSIGQRTYLDYIDRESFVDFFILNELSANPDAYRLSTFMHKDRNGKLAMGPIWDFNLAFGNDGRSQTQTWIYRYNEIAPGDLWLVHFWWTRLMEDPEFRDAIKVRWNSLKSSLLNSNSINAMIDAHVQLLQENGGIERNYAKWPVIGVPLPFNSFVGATYEEEIQYTKDWISDRINWMDGEIQGF
jgi:hypothetical protein